MDMLERRTVDIGCIQEVRFRGQGTRVRRWGEVQVLVEWIRGGQKWSRDHGERRLSKRR